MEKLNKPNQSNNNGSTNLSGYTEAERLGLLWKQQQKKQSSAPSSSSGAPASRRSPPNRTAESYSSRDNGPLLAKSNVRSEPRKWEYNEDDVDEFGRIKNGSSVQKRNAPSQSVGKHYRERRNRSRSRSRSREHNYKNSREDYLKSSRSRSPQVSPRHRSRSRSNESRYGRNTERSNREEKEAWGHDLFDDKFDESSERKKNIPSDYRPPSPEWISRAGGVAIMKRKTQNQGDSGR